MASLLTSTSSLILVLPMQPALFFLSPLNISLQSPRRNQLKGNLRFFLLMEDLLCHEKWAVDMSPFSPMHVHSESRDGGVSEEEYDHGIRICLEKEFGYMPDPGYAEMVREKDLVFARARVMHWLIKSRSRLRLTHETLFLAANCFDRFISIFKSQEWEYWMLELLSVSCLSVSTKFMDAAMIVPSLHEIQVMKDLDHSFEHGVIKKMELTLLKGLGWRLGAITAYSYMDFLELKPNFLNTSQVHDSLLCSLFDIELIKFRPSIIVAAAALTSATMDRESSDPFHANLIGNIIPDDVRMGEVLECKRLMQQSSSNLGYPDYYAPSSPVTVLVASHILVKDSVLDHDVSS